MFSLLKPGEFVAIMPRESAPASEVLEIAPVSYAGNVYIQLVDGRNYSSCRGKSLLAKQVTYIVPATHEHRAALKYKRPQSA